MDDDRHFTFEVTRAVLCLIALAYIGFVLAK